MRGQKRRFARLEMLSGLLVCVLLVCAIPHSASAQAVSLSQARKTVSAAKTPEALLAALRSSLSGMQPRDAITLAEEFETKVPSTSRAEIRFLISGLHQLLGQPGQAAQWARKAAELDRRYLMQAFRFAMASGDLEAAEGIIGQMGPNDTQRLLAEAWIMLMDGNYANIISMPVPSSGTVEQPVRRELLFLAFLADIGVKGSALQSVSLLVRDFPHSPEAGLAQGSVVASAEFILQSGLVIG
ncbi:MAG: hypothetical protein N3A02_04300, partial [Rectinema sp.]|nr:hypothetical protein [Rectinema sp.]